MSSAQAPPITYEEWLSLPYPVYPDKEGRALARVCELARTVDRDTLRELAYHEEAIWAAVQANLHCPGRLEEYRAILKGKVTLKPLDDLIQRRAKELQREYRVEHQARRKTTAAGADDLPHDLTSQGPTCEINITDLRTHELTFEVQGMLRAQPDPPGVLVWGGRLARIRPADDPASKPALEHFGLDSMRGHLDRLADWVKVGAKGVLTPVDPPEGP